MTTKPTRTPCGARTWELVDHATECAWCRVRLQERSIAELEDELRDARSLALWRASQWFAAREHRWSAAQTKRGARLLLVWSLWAATYGTLEVRR